MGGGLAGLFSAGTVLLPTEPLGLVGFAVVAPTGLTTGLAGLLAVMTVLPGDVLGGIVIGVFAVVVVPVTADWPKAESIGATGMLGAGGASTGTGTERKRT